MFGYNFGVRLRLHYKLIPIRRKQDWWRKRFVKRTSSHSSTFKSEDSGEDDTHLADYVNEFDSVGHDYKSATYDTTQDRLSFRNYYGIRSDVAMDHLVKRIHPLDWFQMEVNLCDQNSDFCTLTSELEFSE